MNTKVLKKIIRVQINYAFLPVVLVILALILVFNGQKVAQFELLSVGVMFYITCALLYHFFDKSLTVEVILEYILIAALVLIIIQGLLG